MLYRIKPLLVMFFIVVFALLTPHHASADEASAPNSIVAYNLDSRFLFSFDQETQLYYYCVKKKSIVFPWISYCAIYQENNSQMRCVLRLGDSVSSFFVHNDIIYYTSHAGLGGRGNLVAYNIQSSQREILLPTSLGVGQILGIQDDLLFCEAENHIYSINLSSNTYKTSTEKNYYVTEATNTGISFYADGSWWFYSWQENIATELFCADTPPVSHLHTIALDSNHYVKLDCAQNTATLVSPSSEAQICNALCASIDNNLAAVLTSDGIIHVYSLSTSIDLLCEIPTSTTSQIYLHNNCIFSIDSDGCLCVTELPS